MPITLERTPHQKQVFAKALLDGPIAYSINRTAKITGLDRATVTEIKRRNDYNLEAVQQIQKRLPAKCYITADWAFDNITPEKLEMCSAPQLMMVAGIAIDKARDMEGMNRPIVNVFEIAGNLARAISESKSRLEALSLALKSPSDHPSDLT